MALFQICSVCGSQQNIEPYDFCQTCGHEWESAEIMSSAPVPRPTKLAHDAGDSAASSDIINASAESTSQTGDALTQRV